MDLLKTIESIIENNGAHLYDTVTEKSGDHLIYRILVCSENGVDLGLCTRLSELLSPILDTNPPVSGNYFLEVSSPGVERKIKTLKQFAYSLNDEVLITTKTNEKIGGFVKAVEGNIIILESDDEEIRLPFESVSRAKTIFEW